MFFLSPDKSLTLTQHVNADNGPPLIYIYIKYKYDNKNYIKYIYTLYIILYYIYIYLVGSRGQMVESQEL